MLKKIFEVKNADNTITEVFLNGLKQLKGQDDDFVLTKDKLKFRLGLKETDILTFKQETTIVL